MSEEKKYLTDEELQKYMGKSSWELEKEYMDTALLERMKNTIEKMEAEFKSVKGLKSFIQSGVLVNPHLILSANPSDRGFGLGMELTALGRGRFGEESGTIITVNLRVDDVERLIQMLPEMLKAARLHKGFQSLKEVLKAKSKPKSYRRY